MSRGVRYRQLDEPWLGTDSALVRFGRAAVPMFVGTIQRVVPLDVGGMVWGRLWGRLSLRMRGQVADSIYWAATAEIRRDTRHE